ncbi:MAG TPA: ATP-binding protein [Conexibacter sp.]|jgi:hypothetical protein|nr:ATP-binding protein [Conexibacter sp.]
MRLRIPDELTRLLSGSRHHDGVLRFLKAADDLLADNKTPFFPAYTDHGLDHVQRVLNAAVELIPSGVWKTKLLGPADAAVLACAAALHDLALHVREAGFTSLVTGDPRFGPVAWFDTPQGVRQPDLPWPELWRAFRKEARHLSPSQLDRLLGPRHDRIPGIAYDDELDPATWTEADRLLVGELLRRHHARLAHEIAHGGFPGVPHDVFPVLVDEMPELGDAIGVVARSHTEDLRCAIAYVRHLHGGAKRPAGARLPYLMGLLRIADYFQLQSDRAPALLLHLKAPQSPQSVAEWSRHQAIADVSLEHDDPGAIYLVAGRVPSVGLYLQLEQLFADLQHEMDTTTAVLAETYADPRTLGLRLSRQRVTTNLLDAGFRARLPFVPRHARPRSAEDLFRLVVGDLYGDNPDVAVRELVQNAVDAVRERRRWEQRHGRTAARASLDLETADVLVELRELEHGPVLRVVDRGVGMTPDTAIDFFMTAGASYTPRALEAAAGQPESSIRWMKAGRFGIGVFAAFLLGDQVHVTTRHAGAPLGVRFAYRIGDDQVQLNWVDCPVGTEVTIPFDVSCLPERWFEDNHDRGIARLQRMLERIARYYVLQDPVVHYRAIERTGHEEVSDGEADVPARDRNLPDEWRAVPDPAPFDALLWRLPADGDRTRSGRISHNGIVIAEPDRLSNPPTYAWASDEGATLLERPELAVFDSRHQLAFPLTRYRLSSPTLPCEPALQRSIAADIVAQGLARGPSRHPLAHAWSLEPVLREDSWTPFLPSLLEDGRLCVVWTGPSRDRWIASNFLEGAQRKPGWEELPARAVVTTWDQSFGLQHVGVQTGLWNTVLRDVRRTAEEIAEALRRTALVTVVVTRDQFVLGRRGAQWRADQLELGWTSSRGPAFSDTMHYVRMQPDSDHAGVTARLRDIGQEMVSHSDGGAVGLTLLSGRRSIVPDPVDVVSETWQALVGGAMRRDRRGRAQQAQEVVARHPFLQPMIEAWSRSRAETA